MMTLAILILSLPILLVIFIRSDRDKLIDIQDLSFKEYKKIMKERKLK